MASSSRQFENADSLTEPEPLQTPGRRHLQTEYVIRTKLQIPQRRVASNEIERTGLLDLLDQHARRRVTLIRAPAGYGKSSLIADWARRTDRAVGWLTLDSRDNNGYRFLLYLRTVLEELTEPPPGTRATISSQFPPDLLLDALVSATGSLDEPATLVLDDLHTISDPVVLETLEYLIAFAGFQLSFILISRSMPPIPWSRWQLKGEFTELGSSDLQFTASELTELFASISVSPPPLSEIEAMLAATDGWIAAVQLLTRLSGDGAVAEIPADLTDRIVTSDVLMNYLVEEVLSRQPSERLEFLYRIALCERICGPLAELLTGLANASSKLLEIETAGLFLSPAGQDFDWFKMHPIFREVVLRQSQQRFTEDDVRNLHTKASHWFEEAGYLEEAVQHAVAAENWEMITNLALPVTSEFIAKGESEQVLAWLDSVPRELIDRSPELSLSYVSAVSTSSKPQQLRGLISRYGPIWAKSQDPNIRARGAIPEARLALSKNEWRLAINRGQQALQENDGRNVELEVVARYLISRALWMSGKPIRTRRFLQDLKVMANSYDCAVSRGIIQDIELSLARLQSELGNLLASQVELESIYQRYADDSFRTRVVASKWLAWIAYMQNDLDRCHAWLISIAGLDFAGRLARFEPRWRLLRGRLMEATGDFAGAEDEYQEAIAVAEFRDDIRWQRPARAAYARFALSQNDGDVVEEWVRRTPRPNPLSSVVIEVDESMTYARLFLDLERNLDALDILNPIVFHARTDGRTWDELDGLLLSARALNAIGDQQAARSQLIDAVSLSQPGNAIRPFLDFGEEILDLLADLPREGKNGDHIDRILLGTTEKVVSDVGFVSAVEALTPRELQILRLISLGLTNQAIGERIGIAESTVKRHVSNMLIKLEANNRTEALHRARQLQILSD